MAYDNETAQRILQLAADEFPRPISNLSHLLSLLNLDKTDEETVLNAVDALDKLGHVQLQPPVRMRLDKVLRDFVNLEITSAGRMHVPSRTPLPRGPESVRPETPQQQKRKETR